MIKLSKLTTVIASLGLAIGSTTAMAYEKGDGIVRLGAAYVNQQSGSDPVTQTGLPLPATLTGTNVTVDDDAEIGLTIAYMLTDHIALELLASTPFSHQAEVSGIVPGSLNLAEAKQLPPTLNVQYYPLSTTSKFQPYIGLGVNYTLFFGEKLHKDAANALGSDGDVSLDDSVGLAYQIGADFALTDTFGLNIAIWQIDLDTTATIDLDVGAKIKADIEIDPTVFMIGGAFKF
ncbi:outer membrane beta-barrel protein [Aurantivibrio plasticivorans]